MELVDTVAASDSSGRRSADPTPPSCGRQPSSQDGAGLSFQERVAALRHPLKERGRDIGVLLGSGRAGMVCIDVCPEVTEQRGCGCPVLASHARRHDDRDLVECGSRAAEPAEPGWHNAANSTNAASSSRVRWQDRWLARRRRVRRTGDNWPPAGRRTSGAAGQPSRLTARRADAALLRRHDPARCRLAAAIRARSAHPGGGGGQVYLAGLQPANHGGQA
jgi:hypothetical protein